MLQVATADMRLLLLLLTAGHASASSAAGAATGRFLNQRGDQAQRGAGAGRMAAKGGAAIPDFWRSNGVREGVPEADLGALGSDGSATDSGLDRNLWKGSSMAYDFHLLDNMDPVAPMDRIDTSLGANTVTGHFRDALYVPPYLNPDTFPMLNKTAPPGTPGSTPDRTYHQGDYFHPKIRGGIVAPKERMPPGSYPNQAAMDEVSPVPATAQEDRVAIKFARYYDQVEDRAGELEDSLQEVPAPQAGAAPVAAARGITRCKPGDNVMLHVGNTLVNATVQVSYFGNLMLLEWQPAYAREAMRQGLPTAPCPLAVGCTVFRICRDLRPGGTCLFLQATHDHNWAGMLKRGYTCPPRATACSMVQQVVSAPLASKDGLTCKAAG